MNKETKEFMIGAGVFAVIMFSLLSVMVAALVTGDARDGGESGCIYKSYATRYNPPYRLVCELFRNRTLPNEN